MKIPKIVKFEPKKAFTFKSEYKKEYYKDSLKYKNNYSFLVGDIEATLDKNDEFVFSLGIFFDGTNFYIFYTLLDFYYGIIKYFSDNNIKKKERKIYFHNLNFDIIFFLKEVHFGEELRVINSGNMMLQLSDEELNFVNSISILPMSLKQVVKKWLSIDFKEWENQKSDIFGLSSEELELYCMRDNFLLFMGLYKIFNKIEIDYGIKSFLTIPSLSIKVFKKVFNDSVMLENKASSFFKEDYYFGGHTEKFERGKYFYGDLSLNYYDVNSLYPYIMKDLEVNYSPFKMLKPTLKNVFKLLYEKKNFWIDCTIEIKSDLFRVIPVKFENKNYYPLGVFDCKISHLTLNFLRENNHLFLKEINGLITHTENTFSKPFKNYVKTFYDLRKSNIQYDMVYKLLLNSLYGKFGQNELQTTMVINPKDFLKFESVKSFNNENFLCSLEEKGNYRIDYFRKDIAGLITEKSRLLMASNKIAFAKCGVKSIYQDTDSLIVDKKVEDYFQLSHMIDSKTLGLLKRENNKEIKDSILIGLKLYYLDENLSARKGLKNLRKYDYIRIALALIIKNFISNITKETKFFECSKCKKLFKNSLVYYPRLLFYNDRFTQPKTFINKGFFGIQRVPFYITEISEKLDKLPLNYYLRKF